MITLSANGLLGMEVESMFCEEICPIISHSAETKAEAGLLMALEEYKVQCGLTNMLCSIAFFFFGLFNSHSVHFPYQRIT